MELITSNNKFFRIEGKFVKLKDTRVKSLYVFPTLSSGYYAVSGKARQDVFLSYIDVEEPLRTDLETSIAATQTTRAGCFQFFNFEPNRRYAAVWSMTSDLQDVQAYATATNIPPSTDKFAYAYETLPATPISKEDSCYVQFTGGTAPTDVVEVYIGTGSVTNGVVNFETLLGTQLCTGGKFDGAKYIVRSDEAVTVIVAGISESYGNKVTLQNFTYSWAATCLTGDTLITMADGSCMPIQDIEVGMSVMSENNTPTEVIRVAKGQQKYPYTSYLFDDGTIIKEVVEHRFYNIDEGFWHQLKYWNIGDRARKIDGSTPELLNVIHHDELVDMYNIWTDSKDYWANGLLSGEIARNQPILSSADAETAVKMAASLREDDIKLLWHWQTLSP